MRNDWHSIRKQYGKNNLDESTVNPDPLIQLDGWLSAAVEAGCPEPTAMVLSTSNIRGIPSSRVVLMKGLDETGIAFFTNYESRKGRDLNENPVASLLFFWPEMERQVRIEGNVLKVSAEKSDAYFQSRPEASRISAAISPQSREIPGREWLTDRGSADSLRRFRVETDLSVNPGPPPLFLHRPENWGGYRLIPVYFEFWQGREDRLHDRIAFEKTGDGWRIFRLAP